MPRVEEVCAIYHDTRSLGVSSEVEPTTVGVGNLTTREAEVVIPLDATGLRGVRKVGKAHTDNVDARNRGGEPLLARRNLHGLSTRAGAQHHLAARVELELSRGRISAASYLRLLHAVYEDLLFPQTTHHAVSTVIRLPYVGERWDAL